MKKRLLSTLLVLCITLSLLPGTALATETVDTDEPVTENAMVEEVQTAPELENPGAVA